MLVWTDCRWQATQTSVPTTRKHKHVTKVLAGGGGGGGGVVVWRCCCLTPSSHSLAVSHCQLTRLHLRTPHFTHNSVRLHSFSIFSFLVFSFSHFLFFGNLHVSMDVGQRIDQPTAPSSRSYPTPCASGTTHQFLNFSISQFLNFHTIFCCPMFQFSRCLGRLEGKLEDEQQRSNHQGTSRGRHPHL